MVARMDEPAMKKALWPTFSDVIATVTVVKKASAYGGMVRSCAAAAV